MSRIEQMNTASFRGFDFLVESENTTRGNKLALHEYPNLDDRYAENLGRIPPILNLSCVIHGDNFIQRRFEFERLLELPGVGELIHPSYGSLQVKPGEFTVNGSQREVGKFVFNVPFYRSRDSIEPTPLPATPETATNTAAEARESVTDKLEAEYTEPETGSALDAVVDAMSDALDAVQDSIDAIVDPIQEGIAEAQATINNFQNKITRIMQTATGFKNEITNLYNSILQAANPESLILAWSNLLDFGMINGRPEDAGPTNTVKRLNNATNKSIIAEHTRLIGLVGLMESFANTEFLTDQELTDSQAITDSAYDLYFQQNDLGVVSLANDPDLRENVQQLRSEAKIVLDSQLPNLFRITEINPGKTSMALAAYRFYGNFDNQNSLISLNPGVNVANFNAQIKAVTA